MLFRSVLHYWWLVKADTSVPAIYALILGLLLGMRLWPRVWEYMRPRVGQMGKRIGPVLG